MGNFLFQAACAFSYALKHGLEVTMPRDEASFKNPKYPVYLQHLVNKDWDPARPSVTIKENGFPFQRLPFKEEWRQKNIVFEGYWQTEKYFAEYRDRLIAAFAPEIVVKPTTGTVAVHVRRGDYLRLPKKHPAVSKQWMETQMAKFPGARFTFVSDDIAWSKAEFGRRDDVAFAEGNEVQDLNTMARCENFICSASTFSFWGAWLSPNPDKRIIMPKLWFVKGWGGLDIKDVVPPEWERA